MFRLSRPDYGVSVRYFPVILALILTSGCDDPEISAKALSVLENGVVAAEVECSGSYCLSGPTQICVQYSGINCIQYGPGPCNSTTFHYKAQRLQDGACFVTQPTLELIGRFRTEAAGCEATHNGSSFVIGGGNLTITSSQSEVTVIDLGLECVGHNIEDL